ncbi:glutathione S-transferase family protein [Massilia sp. Root335]|uniref:glutathione S-transferase family protein n=1 Tax=Massilia sp. Root335 TaxID=1736517 RepID=UPI0006FBFE70|nr:glutathione S-transferase [Massilia sp. Root335]KQV45173.1 glutathione S-transferase [Massilia sp. Root335]
MVRILGKASSINVRKVLWTCAELDIVFDREDWGSGFRPTQDPAFIALNPNAMVPVLVDGDVVLWESNTICRYLATRYGDGAAASLLPRDAPARSQVEQWMDWQATELNNAWRYAFMGLVRGSAAHQDPALIAAGIAGWNRHMGILERQLEKTGAYAAGAAFSLADVVLGLSTHRWRKTPMDDRPAYAAVAAWMARLDARPGAGAWLPDDTA